MMTYQQKLARVLDRMGGVYQWRDIEERLDDGRMQAFAAGNSMLVTEIGVFPRARVLECLIAVGDIGGCRELHEQAVQFADRLNIGVIRAYGRRGWLPDARAHGWRNVATNHVYLKEM